MLAPDPHRRQAAHCRVLAGAAGTARLRAVFRRLAENFDRLADQADHPRDLPPAPREPTPPPPPRH